MRLTSMKISKHIITVTDGLPSQRASNTEIVSISWHLHVNGLMQERRNSSANALELLLSCTNLLMHCNKWDPQLEVMAKK